MGALHEPLTMLDGELGFGIGDRPGVIAKQAKPAAVELGDPALQRNLPDRMPPKETRDAPDTHGLVRRGRSRHCCARIALRNQPTCQRAMDRLQVAVVPALIRKIKGQMTSETIDEVGHRAALDIVAELRQMLLKQRALVADLLVIVVEHRQLGRADRKARLGVLGIERTNLAIAALRLLITIHHHQAIAAIHQRIDIIGPDRKRFVIARKRVIAAPERLQGEAEISCWPRQKRAGWRAPAYSWSSPRRRAPAGAGYGRGC